MISAARSETVSLGSPLLSVRNLSKSYGNVSVLKNTSFDVREGEILVLLGASGCGKSTTLRLLAGLERSDTGRIEIRDRPVADAELGIFLPPERRNMGMVFQSFAVWPHMTVEEHVAFPLIARRVPKREIRGRVDKTLDFVGLGAFKDRRATQLSGGQQQRLSLARALVYEPDILLLDEPLSNLDAKLRQQMRIELKRLQQELGSTFILVTHDRVEAMTLAHRIAVMREGTIEQIGLPDDLYDRPNSPFVHGFLGAIIDFSGEWAAEGGSPYVALRGGHKIMPSPDQIPAKFGASRDVRVTIRTADLEVVAEDRAPRVNDLHATVASVIDLGNKYELAVNCDGNDFLLEMSKKIRVKARQRLLLSVDPANVKIWHA
jgi:ABC-type Fe3+/spermidine/putrescine transport system ATPase subunit